MTYYYDRHETLAGVSGANPLLVPRTFASNAINRFFRGDVNAPRLPFQSIELSFATEKERIWFQGGNIQGAYFYHSYPSFLNSAIIVSIAGKIFHIRITGKKGIVSTLFSGNDPVLTHAWFAQGFEWLVIQDGLNKPIVWDGVTGARRAVEGEVPTGSIMATIHGRLVVASADGTNQIAVGDIVYGEDQTSTIDIIRFTETGYWAEGGSFGAPVYVGDLTGMFAMPYLDTGTGQNELVVLGTEGAITLDLSRPRTQWLDSQILRISLIGGGCVSSHSTCALNGDLFFRSAEGIRSFRNARAEFNQGWKQSPISSDVRRWIEPDSPRLLQYNSQVTWNNLLISTCSPMLEGPNNQYAGFHRYHRGFVVMDSNPESNVVREGSPIWQGMWTGIRPVQFVEGRIEDNHRCFAFSYDRDGKNRLYELCESGADTFEGERKKIFSGYDTSVFGTIERTTDNFSMKAVLGGEMAVSSIQEQLDLTLSLRPDSSPCFVEHTDITLSCDCPPKDPCALFTQPGSARISFGGLDDKCDPATGQPLSKTHYWQSRVRMSGRANVDMLAYRFTQQDNPVSCGVVGGGCKQVTCCPERDSFTYHLAPEGDNDEIPDIPIPSDVVPFYQAVKTYTARCPSGAIGAAVNATGAASSYISQADADLKALESARATAESRLNCRRCEPGVLITFTVNNSSEDLSTYFSSGDLGMAGRPWRLIDMQVLTLYAVGYINESGDLITDYALATGDTTFDPGTKVLTDTSGTDVPVALQVACPGSNGNEWPEINEYQPA